MIQTGVISDRMIRLTGRLLGRRRGVHPGGACCAGAVMDDMCLAVGVRLGGRSPELGLAPTDRRRCSAWSPLRGLRHLGRRMSAPAGGLPWVEASVSSCYSAMRTALSRTCTVRGGLVTALVAGHLLSGGDAARAQWLAAQALQSGRSSQPFSPPRVVFAADGTSYAVFTGGRSVYLSERDPRGRFSAPTLIASPSRRYESVSPLGVASYGDEGLVVLLARIVDKPDGRLTRICCARIEAMVRSSDLGVFNSQEVARSAQAAGAWEVSGDSLGAVLAHSALSPRENYVKDLDPVTGKFGESMRVPAEAEAGHADEFAIDGAGDAFAVWVDRRVAKRPWNIAGPPHVRVAIRPAGGPFGPDRLLYSAASSSYIEGLHIDAAGLGRFAAVWVRVDPRHRERLDAYVRSSTSSGRVQTVAQSSALIQDPEVVVADSGETDLFWRDCLRTGCSVMSASSPPGGVFSVGHPISRGEAPATSPSVAGDGRGDIIVAWSNAKGVWATVKAAGNQRFGPAHRVFEDTGPNAGPLASFGPDGEAIVTCTTPDDVPFVDVYRREASVE